MKCHLALTVLFVGVAYCFVQGPISEFDVSTKIFLLKTLGREFTPDEILEIVDTITDREKAEIVTAYNKMRLASPEEIPKSAKEGMAYLKSNAPSLAPKVEKALTKMKIKFDAMRSETKQALLKMLNDLFSAGDRPAEEREFWINYFQSMLPNKYAALPDSVRSDVRKNMPKIDKVLSSFQFRGDADGAKLRAFMGAGALHFDPWKAFNHQCNFPSC
ncbi:hypothetical protein PRIPAC_92227 [Pristionchus pacificus]|uniref:Fatty-acid and retinol-binding protein 1 n=1 Tax=Pristionchus pacificus TaxID=54126 RepID=A0A454XU21_PRIPA|nr:hypothetical protein PRIPAC_92227 [Pristionchus pacificus]|eukprot:PDM62983.1 hypothetical protein PRIPAC_50198 [Pristionchus pacificus]